MGELRRGSEAAGRGETAVGLHACATAKQKGRGGGKQRRAKEREKTQRHCDALVSRQTHKHTQTHSRHRNEEVGGARAGAADRYLHRQASTQIKRNIHTRTHVTQRTLCGLLHRDLLAPSSLLRARATGGRVVGRRWLTGKDTMRGRRAKKPAEKRNAAGLPRLSQLRVRRGEGRAGELVDASAPAGGADVPPGTLVVLRRSPSSSPRHSPPCCCASPTPPSASQRRAHRRLSWPPLHGGSSDTHAACASAA